MLIIMVFVILFVLILFFVLVSLLLFLMWEGFYSIIRLGVYELLKVYFGVIDFVYILLWKKICVGVILGWLLIDIEREFKLNVFCIVSYRGMEIESF